MLAVVLTVLKIIGIVLLCLVLTVLVVAGLVLFVPIRYRASGYYHEDYSVKARVNWLFHLISARFLLQKDNEMQLVVRVLGIPVYDMQKKKRKEAMKKSADKKTADKKKKTKKADADTDLDTNSDTEIITAKPPVPHRPGSEEKKLSLDEHKRIHLIDKCKAFWEKCKQSIFNIKYTILKIYDKIKNIKDNITYYMELLEKKNTKLAIAACKKELLRIWKDIKPKRFRANILLGMEDPATTGQIIGYCAMLYPVHQGNITVVPEFDEKVFKADFSLKGKITVYVYIIVAYTILFNKNIKHLKKCLLREDS